MLRRTVAVTLSAVLAAGLLLGSGAEAAAKKKRSPKKPVIKPALAMPNARDVELFEAMEAGDIETRVVPNDPFSAKVLIENKTDEPLNIKFPNAVVAAPILPQFGGGGMGMGGMGMGGGGMGMGGGAMGGGFFSVPPEKIVSVPLNTVCLQHGKTDPNRSMRYRLLPIETVTENPVLTELLTIVAAGKIDRQAAQAAAWHITDDLSWGQLASKEQVQINGTIGSYFHRNELIGAQQLLAVAIRRAEAQQRQGKTEDGEPVITRTSSAARVLQITK